MFFKDDFLVSVDFEEQDNAPPPSVPLTLSVPVSGDSCSAPDDLGNCQAAKEVAPPSAGGGEVKERSCDSLVMCIVTTLNQGLRNGGGIGDILRAPSSKVEFIRRSQKDSTNLNIFRRACLWHV